MAQRTIAEKKIRYSERESTLKTANRVYDEKLAPLKNYPCLHGYLTTFEVVSMYMIYGISPAGDGIQEYISEARAGISSSSWVYYDFPNPEAFDIFIDFVEGV